MDTLCSYDELDNGFSQQQREYRAKRPNILICGYTGSGKSSLIRAVLGDIVPASAIGSGRPQTQGYDRYENDDIVIYDSRGLEMGEQEETFLRNTERFIREHQMRNLNDIENHIHLVWYTLQGPGARVTDCDRHLMQNIFDPNETIAIITKADISRSSQIDAMTRVIAETGIPRNHIIPASDAEGGCIGCKTLMELTARMLPEATKNAFYSAQKVDQELRVQAILNKKQDAYTVIGIATAAAAVIGASPIPFSDAALLCPGQLCMIGKLAALYGQENSTVRHAILPVFAQTGGVMAAASLSKFLPGLGSLIGAGVASTLTGAMGWYVQNSLEKNAIAIAKGEDPPGLHFDFSSFMSFFDSYKSCKGTFDNFRQNPNDWK